MDMSTVHGFFRKSEQRNGIFVSLSGSSIFFFLVMAVILGSANHDAGPGGPLGCQQPVQVGDVSDWQPVFHRSGKGQCKNPVESFVFPTKIQPSWKEDLWPSKMHTRRGAEIRPPPLENGKKSATKATFLSPNHVDVDFSRHSLI